MASDGIVVSQPLLLSYEVWYNSYVDPELFITGQMIKIFWLEKQCLILPISSILIYFCLF
jgi:hypothetical protein